MTTKNEAPSRSSDTIHRQQQPLWFKPILAVAGILLALGYYWSQTQLPNQVTIAGGPAGGRYDQLARQIAMELESRLDISVDVIETRGSMDNLQAVQNGQADLGFYQPETQFILDQDKPPQGTTRDIEFVSNLYSEYLLPILARKSHANQNALVLPSIRSMMDADYMWACNGEMSGDYAMLQLLANHLEASPDEIQIRTVSYSELPAEFNSGNIDLAVLCCGLRTPILQTLFKSGNAYLVELPFADALRRKNVSLRKEVIPTGYFTTKETMIPPQDFQTVALRAQLITTSDVSVSLIEEVTRVIMEPQFQRRQQLTELFSEGKTFATASPEFPIHDGASHIYQPELKPLLNPDFVEGTEGLRSFLVSMIAAFWLLRRWWVRRQLLQQEHRLDRYIKDLLELEMQQLGLDGNSPDDEQPLQDLLDEVTRLRQEALAEFTAHELNEDRAVDCFIEMCHALSDKISGKLTRLQLGKLLTKEN